MALKELLNRQALGPHFKAPTLKVQVICSRVHARVVAWDFSEVSATPRCTKMNKSVVISDGHSVTTLTLLEEFSSKVDDGKGYLLRGYTLKGVSPPRCIWVGRETQFFRSSPIEVSDELKSRAQALLFPESTVTALEKIHQAKGLITVVGQVTELSAIKKIIMGREQVPMRTLQLQEGAAKVDVALWREVAISKLEVGATLKISHLKKGKSVYEDQLNSTNYSVVEMLSASPTSALAIEVLGVIEGEMEGMVDLILGDDSQVSLSGALWEPMEELLAKGRLFVDLQMRGKTVEVIKVVEAPPH
ncbi:uncharacterized protein PAE49_016585 [Odontesthes bonariensis]|uniref:uncharacterized protein LOC142400931 n=1 Tax=Odontesthes bonariensis TaxID=219752 RepID=UPI003F5805E0